MLALLLIHTILISHKSFLQISFIFPDMFKSETIVYLFNFCKDGSTVCIYIWEED